MKQKYPPSSFLAIAGMFAVVMLAVHARATPNDDIIIDPDQEAISATSYYPTFGQVPSKMVDNSGLASRLGQDRRSRPVTAPIRRTTPS
jgi:hypothetical protein